MDLEELKVEVEKGKDLTPCKGRVYRGYASCFMSSDGRIEKREGIKLLSKRSCKGCEKCSWMLDDLSNADMIQDFLIFPDQIEKGALYGLEVIGGKKDYWGEVDDYYFRITEIKEK